jgi:serine/threonine protein kinase
MAGSPDVLAGTFAGRYTIERELGSGATATVYLARDTQRGMSVAVKLLRHELSQSVGAERFLREIRLNEKLHHPHIVPVLDSGEHDGRLYFVLPHMEEGSLRQLLQREKQLPIERAIQIAKTVAEALDYAHQQKLIHRDVKPENILFTAGQACLADFGIARAVERAIDESTTDTGLVRGTPAYMSPEQASGSKHCDGRSDQYSLACVLYEMLAGVPAFIGPTPEAVIAQRFQHLPRELRVYRPNAPAAIDDVLMKALAMAPADRYASTAEFAAMLETALRTPTAARRASGPSIGITRSKLFALSGTAAVVAAVAFALSQVGAFTADPATLADSTQVAVFPFRTVSGSAHPASQELVHAALRRWQPLNVVALSQVAEGLRAANAGDSPSLSDARAVAAGLGAGRFVLGQVVATPSGQAVLAEYRDVSGRALYSAQMDLPRDSSSVRAVYEALVDSLLLRGMSVGGPLAGQGRHLFATQSFIDAQRAREAWALERADSLLSRATEFAPHWGRAHLWLAQIKMWQGQPLLAASIERAAADTAALLPDERALALPLMAMHEGRHPDACVAYQRIVSADSRSFAGWYGLGECRRRDVLVLRDARSASGWRFRSDYEAELRAYVRAFELFPSAHLGFQANGYSRLRALFFTSGRTLRRGTSQGKDFLGSLQLVRDSLRIVPWESSVMFSGDSRTNADARAISRSRAHFHAIASRWSAAFPRSAAGKEAVAVSLELQADPAALDTLIAAETLASDREQRLRFAAARPLLRLKFAIPDDIRGAERAKVEADSVLSRHPQPSPAEAALLAPLAALRGNCSLMARLIRRAAHSGSIRGVRLPPDLLGDAQALAAQSLLGCNYSMDDVSSIAARTLAATSDAEVQRAIEYSLLSATVGARFPLDSAWVTRLAPMGDYVLQAEAHLLAGDTLRAADGLRRVREARRSQTAGDVSIDAVLQEALLLLAIGDSATARSELAAALGVIRSAEPLAPFHVANNTSRVAAMLRAMSVSAMIARDSSARHRWHRIPSLLWNDADPKILPR